MPAVDDRSHVDIDDVAVLQSAVAGNAVTHDMVDRGAAALGIAAVAERRRDGAFAQHVFADDVVELAGRDARNDVRNQRVEDLGRQSAGPAHAGEAFRAMKFDHAVAGFDPVLGTDGDIFGHVPHISALARFCTRNAADCRFELAPRLRV